VILDKMAKIKRHLQACGIWQLSQKCILLIVKIWRI